VTSRSPRPLHASTRSSLLVLALVVGALGLFASPAAAGTVDCPPMGTDVCKDLEPVAECVWDNRNGTKTALWGWNNPTSDTARIAIGPKNGMGPGGDNQGQPTLFAPGRQLNVFTTTFTGPKATWRLGNNVADADNRTTACATKPVPQVGSIGALLAVGFVLTMTAVAIIAGRPRVQQTMGRGGRA
jgi:hypothetical protein